MAILNTYIQQPIDRLDYDFEYRAPPDFIESAEFSVEPAGLTLDGKIVEPGFTKIWISGGEAGMTYKVSCTITTDKGRIKQDEIKIRVREY